MSDSAYERGSTFGAFFTSGCLICRIFKSRLVYARSNSVAWSTRVGSSLQKWMSLFEPAKLSTTNSKLAEEAQEAEAVVLRCTVKAT